MKITVDEGIFCDRFVSMGRGEQFSREALGLLFDYYEGVDRDMELDVIGICCDWTEYENMEEIKKEHNVEDIDDLESNTTVLTNDRENGPYVVLNY